MNTVYLIRQGRYLAVYERMGDQFIQSVLRDHLLWKNLCGLKLNSAEMKILLSSGQVYVPNEKK